MGVRPSARQNLEALAGSPFADRAHRPDQEAAYQMPAMEQPKQERLEFRIFNTEKV